MRAKPQGQAGRDEAKHGNLGACGVCPKVNTTAGKLFARFPFLFSALATSQKRWEESPSHGQGVSLVHHTVVNIVTSSWLCCQGVFMLGGSGGTRPCAGGHILLSHQGQTSQPPKPGDARLVLLPSGCWRIDCLLIQSNNQE